MKEYRNKETGEIVKAQSHYTVTFSGYIVQNLRLKVNWIERGEFEQQYVQEVTLSDEPIKADNFKKYVHRKTGKIVEAEYDRAYHGEWLYFVKNPVKKEHRIMAPKWFNEEYSKI